MKKILSIALLVALMVSLLAGCSSGATTTAAPAATTAAPAAGETTAAPAAGDAGTYALIVKNTGNPYNEKEAEGFVKAVEEFGGKVIVKRPANPTAEDQIAMINELVSQKVSAIAIAANDVDALQPACEKDMAGGKKNGTGNMAFGWSCGCMPENGLPRERRPGIVGLLPCFAREKRVCLLPCKKKHVVGVIRLLY